MSQQNPTIIVGHLDDSELTKSIDKLVSEVAKKTSGMAEDFTQAIDKMKFAMKDFAITQKVSVDLMNEAWRDMSKSFDAMVAAQSTATGGGKGSGKAFAPNTLGELEQNIAKIKQERRELELNSDELRTRNALLERSKNLYKEQTTSPATRNLNAVMGMQPKSLSDSERQLKLLEFLQRRYANSTELSVSQQNRLARAIQRTKEQIDKLKPKSLNEVLGMDANSIDQIAAKMRALKMVRIDTNNAAEVKRVGDAYAELKRKQAQLMGQNIQLTHSNNYLAQSFGYIRNRIVYALTLGALTNFIKQLYEIRGQYELLERSLGVLVGSFEKGTQIFNELNEMAIKSPFTLIELGTAAKQLTAYNFAANEVVDTTRRLADISAALGVPMERLTYNLGQIKAQGVLNARDARDFANAGLAIVPMLAKMYTEQKTFGDEMVTTAQVYDMMSKKMVTYSDVLKVLYRVTDEGGKFFDFQAKQADTLRVQMANLTLAYNNMLNEIGSENQGLLTTWVSGLKTLLKNWKEISRAILTLVTTLGTYKAVATIVSALNSRMFVGGVLVGLRNYILGIKNATGAMATFNAVTRANPIAFLISALVAAIGYFALFNHKVKEASEEVEMFGESSAKSVNKVKTLQKILQGTEETSSTYKKTLSELSQIAKEYGIQINAEKASRDEANNSAKKTIELIREESAERQRANQFEKARERYETQTGEVKSDFTSALKGLEGWFGTTSKTRKELIDNAEAISDVTSSIIEENIQLVVGKTGDEALSGIKEIKSKISNGLQRMGISSESIEFLFNRSDMRGHLRDIINGYKDAAEAQENHNQKIENYYQKSKKITNATMTFTEKVNANARALRNNTDDAISLYNKIYDIVKIAQQNHTINFDLKLTAEKPPKWMFDKSLPELQQLAERFTAIAQSGGHAKGYDRESTYERGLLYASAARIKQEEEERNARNKDKKTRTKQSDEIAKAIKNEISLVKELQGAYDTLTKKGDSHANAIAKVQDLYGKTINLLNKDMDKFGLPRLDLSIIKGNNHNEVLAFFEKLRDVLESKGISNLERMEAVEGVVKEFRLKADTYNLDMITKGLNNELGKLKDEYELAVELDANPELGDMFADMFGIDTKGLPHTFGEAYDRANKIAKEKLNELKVDTKDFDLMSTVIKGDKDNKWLGLEITSQPVQDLIKNQKTWQDMFKKNMLDTEKMLDDYIKKYGDYSDKIAEIEANRLEKLKKLNEAYYTEEMRKRPEYIAKLNAIEQGANKEKQQVDFDEFKNSRYYTMMFENLDYISTKTIRDMRDRVRELMDTMNDLTPEQLKTLVSQYEKLEQKLVKRSPFKTLTKDLKEYFATTKERKAANQEFKNAQKEYDVQRKNVAALKEKYEQAKANSNTSQSRLDFLQIEIDGENDILKILKKQLDAAQKKADKYNLTAKLAKSEALQVAGVVADNAKSLSGLRDFLQNDLGVELSDEINGFVDGMNKMGEGINNIISSATSGNVVGVLTGVGQTIYGIFDGISSIFGGGSNDKKITEQIKDSERAVKRLELTYKNLEVAIENAYGANVIGAKQAAIANKELQLAELKRQLALEKSRDSKKRDEDRIIELQGQIIDLQNDIKRSAQEIATELLGISSVGDAALSFMDAYISALRKGEDAQAAFTGSWKEMIASMIKQLFVTKVIGPELEKLVDEMNERIKNRSTKETEDYQKAVEEQTRRSNLGDDEIRAELAKNHQDLIDMRKKELEEAKELAILHKNDTYSSYYNNRYKLARLSYLQALWGITTITQEEIAAYKAEGEKAVKDAKKELDKATTPTIEDMRLVAEEGKQTGENLKGLYEDFDSMLKEFDLYDQTSKNLSALQQGIQGITENTAGALEAYMNGVSQQVYVQTEYLRQIAEVITRDDNPNDDVKVASLSQILLQLQSSYQVQSSIQGILEGWNNPSGQAVRVELVS